MRHRIGLPRRALHVLVLASFALAQPVYDRLSRNAVLLEDLDIGLPSLLLVIITLSLLVPACIIVLEALFELRSKALGERVHCATVLVATVAVSLQVVGRLALLPGLVGGAIALGAGVAASYAYSRYAPVQWLFTAASPAIIIFPAALLFRSPVAHSLFDSELPLMPRATVSNPVSVFVVMFDEFSGTSLMNRDRGINGLRYPHFAQFSQEATWYRNATSVHWRTLSAVPAMLTGKYPEKSGQGTLREHPVNLFTLLRSSQAYDLVVFEPVTRLCPPSGNSYVDASNTLQGYRALLSIMSIVYLHDLMPADVWPLLPDIPNEWFGARDPSAASMARTNGVMRYGWNRDRDRQFGHYLDCVRVRRRPTLYFLHVVLPHFPWCYLPSGQRYAWDNGSEIEPLGARGAGSENWSSDVFAVQQSHQRYLLQVGYCDYMLEQLLARIKAANLYDSSLIIVTADHGVCFQADESRRAPRKETLDELMPIPLFIKEPGQHEPKVSDRNVESIDLLPTILDVVDLTPRVPTDGSSLRDATQPERSSKFFYGENAQFTADSRFEAKFGAVDRMIDCFGESWPDLYKIGGFGALIGRPVSELCVGDRSMLKTELNRSEFVLAPNRPVPCFLRGHVVSATESELPLHFAIAVNGTVRGTSRTYAASDMRDRWSVMLPESSFHEGVNSVEVFVISAAGQQLLLHPCEIAND